MANQRVENIKPNVLRQCREQIGLSIEQAEKKVGLSTLEKIERGESKPTFNQLTKLAERYHVPQWVFLREELPNKYDFGRHMPSFRQFAETSPVFSHEARVIAASVEKFRELIIELRIDMEEPIQPFSPPSPETNIVNLVQLTRTWLESNKSAYLFEDWKKALERKGVFVFLTSKYSDWSKVDPKLFRGFAIYRDTLPIIVINDSDALSAQSFTLFHEFGHLLRKESSVDTEDMSYSQSSSERWCNQFAGEILMPRDVFEEESQRFRPLVEISETVKQIDEIAKRFKVSSSACAVRMRQVRKISENQYHEIDKYLKERYKKVKEERKKGNVRMKRNIAKEKLHQYGHIYSQTLIQAYRDQEIGLHKLCKLFRFKKVTDAIKLESLL